MSSVEPLDLRQSSPHVNLNLNVRGLGQSATLAINERCARLRAEGRHIYRLGLGQSPFPVPELVAEALRDNAHQKDYLPVQGLPELRQAIVGYLERTEGLSFSPQNVLVGPGTKELMFLVQLTYYGDLVIPAPSWVSYAPQAHIIGRHLRWLPTDPAERLEVTPAALDALCRRDPGRPRLLILNSPGNPTGTAYAADRLEAIAEVARRHRVLILSDEIYSGLHFEGEHVSIARYYPEGTIISNGLSKWCGAGGWRLGAFAFPDSLAWLREAMAAVASETFTSTSAPIQYAAARAFGDEPELEDYLLRARSTLAALGDYAQGRLAAAGADVIRPEGGFYLFPSFQPLRERLLARGIASSEALCARLLEDTGVALLPGDVFGRPLHELFARIAMVDFDGERAMSALWAADGHGLPAEAFLREHCAGVTDAIDRLCDWLGA